jgi:hypothetical protein
MLKIQPFIISIGFHEPVFMLRLAGELSPCLKINIKNGLSKPRENTLNTALRMLNRKYVATSLGYLPTYLKMERKLFIVAKLMKIKPAQVFKFTI